MPKASGWQSESDDLLVVISVIVDYENRQNEKRKNVFNKASNDN